MLRGGLLLLILCLPAPAVASVADWLRGGSAGAQDYLPVDEAFVPQVRQVAPDRLEAEWHIEPDYYLYREQLGVDLNSEDLLAAGYVTVPEGEKKTDEYFGTSEVYFQRLTIDIQLPRDYTGETLTLRYQGCAVDGICYAPVERSFNSDNMLVDAGASGARAGSAPPDTAQGRLGELLGDGQMWLIGLTFFGLGLLLAFTPCVLPMVPILLGLITGQGQSLTTRRAFSLSLVYVLAMAATYTAAGIAAGLLGQNLQMWMQHPAVLIPFAAIMVGLALSMFGLFTVQVPQALQQRLTALSNRQRGGTFGGAATMGLLSALIVGPCLAAPLAGALIYIGQTGDAVLGGWALLTLSLGMGVPLLLAGASAGHLLPRAGPWMAAIKTAFGILLLAVAVWMIGRLVPGWVALVLWGLLAFITAGALGTFTRPAADAGILIRLRQGLGLAVLAWGLALLVGGASGGTNPWQPLAHLALSGERQQQALPEFTLIQSVDDLERELTQARAANQPVMLEFYADWCVDCIRMERTTFRDRRVHEALAGARLLKADVTAHNASDRELMQALRVLGPPSMLFWDTSGQEDPAYRVMGYMRAGAFAEHASQALNTRADAREF